MSGKSTIAPNKREAQDVGMPVRKDGGLDARYHHPQVLNKDRTRDMRTVPGHQHVHGGR
jgi:hypothetical protein